VNEELCEILEELQGEISSEIYLMKADEIIHTKDTLKERIADLIEEFIYQVDFK
jgi:hypothetical protein